MANKAVSLTKRVVTPAGKRYCPVVISANGRIKPHTVLIDEAEEAHPEGAYYLSWYEGKQCVRRSVGKDPTTAYTRLLKKQAELAATAKGVTVVPESQDSRRRVDASVLGYLDEIALTKKATTLSVYRTALEYFQQSCSKMYLDEMDRTDLLRFTAFLRDEKEQAPRSVHNKFANVMSFLKHQGIKGLARKNDWPTYTEEEPVIYEPEELSTLFAACTPEERLLFRFALCTGFRDQELMHVTWKDVNFGGQTVSVKHKPQYDWTPKAYKERTVPLNSDLIGQLQAARKSSTSPLLFPAKDGKPEHHMLRKLKGVAERAGLDSEEFWLHKFRSTFATTCLQSGVDLRTVQHWMGHTDLASTMRYLRPARGAAIQAKVETIWAAY